MTSAATARETVEPSRKRVRLHPLAALLVLAAALRLPLAFWPNIYAPDEIFQFIEPAWRILGHDSIISWEWRTGIRGWTMPTLLAGPVALGNWLAPGGSGVLVMPRLFAALASLSIVASAWGFGARVSQLHAGVAGFVAAIWFEFILFAPHTLGEPLATALILPAAWLLTVPAPSRTQLVAAGAMLALAFVCRFQYAPAIGVLVIGACWRQWLRLVPVVCGGAVVLIVAGGIDALNGAVPFAWLVANVQHNLLNGRAAEAYGRQPLTEYVGNLMVLWSIAIVPIAIAVWTARKHAPLLLWVALVNLVFHSMIGHKEHRFVFLSVALLIVLAALGSADVIARLRQRPGWHRVALPLVIGAWIATSAVLGSTGAMPDHWWRGVGATRLAQELRHDPGMCGLALYEMPFFMLPGRESLAGPVPVYSFDARDPAAVGGASAAARTAQAGFNRILARSAMASQLPANFAPGRCTTMYGENVCVYQRAGTCDAAPAASFLLNDVLVRIDL